MRCKQRRTHDQVRPKQRKHCLLKIKIIPDFISTLSYGKCAVKVTLCIIKVQCRLTFTHYSSVLIGKLNMWS